MGAVAAGLVQRRQDQIAFDFGESQADELLDTRLDRYLHQPGDFPSGMINRCSARSRCTVLGVPD